MEKELMEIKNKFNSILNKKVLIACSTGVDSMVLLDMAIKYLGKDNIGIAHVNHKKRAESEDEEKYIKKYALKHNIPLYVHHLDTNTTENFQSYARTARYDFFNELSINHNYEYVLLAHHADDNLETIIMRFLKSSSLKGYAGMEQETVYKNVKVYRPLLEVSKDFIINYAQKHKIKYFDDLSNEEFDYHRNRIRHKIIPYLKLENPNLINAVNNYHKTLISANNIIENHLELFEKEHIKYTEYENLKIYSMDYFEFNDLDEYIKKEILFKLTKQFQLSKKTVEELQEQIKNKHKYINSVYDNLTIIKEYNNLQVIIGKINVPNFEIDIFEEGTYVLPNNLELSIEKFSSQNTMNNNKVCYNIDTLFVDDLPVTIRTKLPGDKIKTKSGTSKVSDILTNNKVTYLERNYTLIVIYNNEVKNVLIYQNDEEDI